jgi:hypothetical protein
MTLRSRRVVVVGVVVRVAVVLVVLVRVVVRRDLGGGEATLFTRVV